MSKADPGVAGARQDEQVAQQADEGRAPRPKGLRVTVNLTAKAAAALESLEELTGYSKTDSINRALIVYATLERLAAEEGADLLIRRGAGDLERLRFL